MRKVAFLLFFPLLVAFDYKPSLESWVLNSSNIGAERISIYQSLNSKRMACEHEKKNSLFPINCFFLLIAMKKIDSKLDLQKHHLELTQLCIERVDQLKTTHQIQQVSSIVGQLGHCQKHFLEQKELIFYSLEK